MSGVFISYRRDDSAGFAGRLFDFLVKAFPGNTVFIDIDGIDAGRDFVEALNERLASCEVLLAVIGRQWLEAAPDGTCRLDKPDDYVRLEIETALRRNIRVIPILVGGTQMPPRGALPDALEPLTRRHALEISHARFAADAQGLVEILTPLLSAARDKRGRPPGGINRIAVAGVAVLAALPIVLLLAVWAMRSRPPAVDPPSTERRADVRRDDRRPAIEEQPEAPAPRRTEAAPRAAEEAEQRSRQTQENRPPDLPTPRSAPPLQVRNPLYLDTSKAVIEVETGPNKLVKRRAWCERLTIYTEFGHFSMVDWHRDDWPGQACLVRTDWKDHRTEAILGNDTSPWPQVLNATLKALCPRTFARKVGDCVTY